MLIWEIRYLAPLGGPAAFVPQGLRHPLASWAGVLNTMVVNFGIIEQMPHKMQEVFRSLEELSLEALPRTDFVEFRHTP